MAWEDGLLIINGPLLSHDRRWTQGRLLRAVKADVRDGFLPAEVLDRAERREADDSLPAIVAAIKGQIPASRCRRSVTGWKPCASARRVGA